MMAWAFYTMPSEEELQRQRAERELAEQERVEQQDADSNQVEPDRVAPDISEEEGAPPAAVMGVFQESGVQDTVYTVVRTPDYKVVFTNLGAGPVRYELMDHQTWDQQPVQMIGDSTRSAYVLGFLSSQNYNVETDQLLFRQVTEADEIVLNGENTAQLQYVLEPSQGGAITFTYTFHAHRHLIELDIRFDEMEEYIIGSTVDFGWRPPLQFTELDRSQEVMYTGSYLYAGGVLENFSIEGPGQDELVVNGNIDWVATKTKFFTQIIKPLSGSTAAQLLAEIDGEPEDPETVYHYRSWVTSSIPQDGVLQYELYLGPLDYYQLRDLDDSAFDMADISYQWMRWFADPLVKWVIIPYFDFTSNYIANYGILIILFGILVKLMLAPLTSKSFKSMAAMRELQPHMKEIQEKYKENPKKQQEETIKLYKKAKVNPLGGCLPMLLQFPILITLWRYFQTSIVIRQEPFLWASDLSAPDYILSLPVAIPFLGDQLAGFVLLMTAAMVVQTKISGGMSSGSSPAGAPNMKFMTYLLPVMLLFVFNNFAAGLSLYYLVYNVMSIGQQFLINKDLEINIEEDEDKKRRARRGRKKRNS